MTTARPARPTLAGAAAVLLLGSLAACGSDGAGTGAAPPPDLRTVLDVDMKGLATAAVPEPPDAVCRGGGHGDEPAPVLPGSLGDPTAIGFASEDADLHAWAWRTESPETATTVVDEAVAARQSCSYQIHFDADTDGDGEIDAGGSETQTARPWADGTWTGMAASGQFFGGGGAELVESRFVRSGDVVLLVVLTIHGNDDALVPTVDAYLDGVATRLR